MMFKTSFLVLPLLLLLVGASNLEAQELQQAEATAEEAPPPLVRNSRHGAAAREVGEKKAFFSHQSSKDIHKNQTDTSTATVARELGGYGGGLPRFRFSNRNRNLQRCQADCHGDDWRCSGNLVCKRVGNGNGYSDVCRSSGNHPKKVLDYCVPGNRRGGGGGYGGRHSNSYGGGYNSRSGGRYNNNNNNYGYGSPSRHNNNYNNNYGYRSRSGGRYNNNNYHYRSGGGGYNNNYRRSGGKGKGGSNSGSRYGGRYGGGRGGGGRGGRGHGGGGRYGYQSSSSRSGHGYYRGGNRRQGGYYH